MEDEPTEEVEQLKALFDEAQAAIVEKERQLAEAEKKLGEAEVTFAAKCDEQVTAVRMECELDKLWDIEALCKNFDKERQSFPPLPAFTGESEEDNFERWLESFEDRAKVAGWSSEQSLYQLKCHLSKTVL